MNYVENGGDKINKHFNTLSKMKHWRCLFETLISYYEGESTGSLSHPRYVLKKRTIQAGDRPIQVGDVCVV